VAVTTGASADVIAAIVVAPVLFLLTLPTILGEARRQANATVGWVLGAGVAVKLVGALLRYAVAFGVYGGRSDAATYGASASSVAHGIWAGTIHLGGHLSGTGLIELFTGVSYAVTGSSLLASYLVFAWVGFWGQYLSYRAFAIAVPEGRLRDYALLVFFLPSLAFWPSSVGKEAPMLFALGFAAFGVPRMLAGRRGGITPS